MSRFRPMAATQAGGEGGDAGKERDRPWARETAAGRERWGARPGASGGQTR